MLYLLFNRVCFCICKYDYMLKHFTIFLEPLKLFDEQSLEAIKLTFVPCNCMGDLMTDAFSCDCSYLVIMTRYMTVSCLEGVVNDSVSDGTLSLNFIAFLPLISCTGRNVLTGIQYWYIS